MKYIFTLLLFLLSFSVAQAQQLRVLHTRWVGGISQGGVNSLFEIHDAVTVGDSLIVFTGWSHLHNGGDMPPNPALDSMKIYHQQSGTFYYGRNVIIGVMDKDQNLLMLRNYGGRYSEEGRRIIKTQDGGFAILGISQSSLDHDVMDTSWSQKLNPNVVPGVFGYLEDLWLLKLDAQFNVQWSRLFGSPHADLQPFALTQCANGDFVFAQTARHAGGDVPFVFVGGSFAPEDWVIYRTDSLGNKRWSKTYGGTDGEAYRGSLHEVNGNIYLQGSSLSNDYDCTYNPPWGNTGYGTPRLIVLDDTGRIVRSHFFGGSKGNGLHQGIYDSERHHFVFIGTASSRDYDLPADTPLTNKYRAWIFCVDTNGVKKWSRLHGDHSSDNIGFDITKTGDGNYFCAWQTYKPIPPWQGIEDDDAWALLIDSNGNEIVQKIFGSREYEHPHCVATLGNSYFVLGYQSPIDEQDSLYTEGTNSPRPTAGYRSFVSRLAHWSLVVDDHPKAKGKRLQLTPNPASRQLRVSWGDELRDATIRIVDASGKEVLRQRIRYSSFAVVDVSAFSPGAYVVSLLNPKHNSIISEKLIIQ